jgi:hypothetical protein
MNYVRLVNTEVVVCSPQSLTDCMGIETRPLQQDFGVLYIPTEYFKVFRIWKRMPACCMRRASQAYAESLVARRHVNFVVAVALILWSGFILLTTYSLIMCTREYNGLVSI